MENPEEFGMTKNMSDSNDLWVGNGAKIQRNKKVRVSTKI